MRTIDKRAAFLGVRLGHEAIALSKRERETLARASEILDEIRARRAREYFDRGYGETLDLAGDLADDADDLILATVAAYLGEVVSEIESDGEVVILPERTRPPPRN